MFHYQSSVRQTVKLQQVAHQPCWACLARLINDLFMQNCFFHLLPSLFFFSTFFCFTYENCSVFQKKNKLLFWLFGWKQKVAQHLLKLSIDFNLQFALLVSESWKINFSSSTTSNKQKTKTSILFEMHSSSSSFLPLSVGWESEQQHDCWLMTFFAYELCISFFDLIRCKLLMSAKSSKKTRPFLVHKKDLLFN